MRVRLAVASAVTAAFLASAVASAQARPFPGWGGNPGYFATPSGKTVCEYAHVHARYHLECVPFNGRTEPTPAGYPGFPTWGVHDHGRAYQYVLLGNPPSEARHAKYGVIYR